MNQIKILYDASRMITKKSTTKKIENFMVLFSYIVLVVLHWFHHFVKGILKNLKKKKNCKWNYNILELII